MSIRDARTDAVGPVLAAPVCIVGAGAAGITLARALAAKNAEVLLIESGGLDYDDATQALYRGPNLGLPYHDLDACRLRYFGGTTNHWAGYCRSNDPINYASRPDLRIDGWPVTFDELEPYVAASAAMLGISPEFFDPGALLADMDAGPVIRGIGAEPDFSLAVNQIADDIRFAERFGGDFEVSGRLHLVTHLNATDIEVGEDGATVASLTCATLTGKTVTVRARHFVLACHSIENARLLLASNAREANGVGNAHDHVGRHFMEHPYVHASLLITSDTFPRALERRYATRNHRLAGLSLSETTMRETGSLAYTCYFTRGSAQTELQAALRGVASGWGDPLSAQFLADVRTVLSDPEFAAGALARRLGLSERQPFLALEQMIEQAPDPSSRVRLFDGDRDPFGKPRAALDWRLNDLDLHTLRTGQKRVVRALGSLGYGRVRVEKITEELVSDRVIGHYHHYGTTRMAAAPSRGVVDRNLRVFGKHNLHICGGSVFPTSGAHGPTLHIIALALRLADRLETDLGAG